MDFIFPGGTVLNAGGSLYVSPNVTAFRNRLTSPKGGENRYVVGPYAGRLSALGIIMIFVSTALVTIASWTGQKLTKVEK